MAMYMRMVRCSNPLPALRLNNICPLEQQSHDSCPDAPVSLREGLWDQPKLRTWIRFAPRLRFSLPLPEDAMPLPWSEVDHRQRTITGRIASLAHIIKQRLSAEVHHFNNPCPSCGETMQMVNTGIAWITSKVVHDWYNKARVTTQRAFSAWVLSVCHFLEAGLEKSGGLITLSYLVCHSLFPFLLTALAADLYSFLDCNSLHGVRAAYSTTW